jgi:hypothetical protein
MKRYIYDEGYPCNFQKKNMLCPFANERFDGFENISKSFGLVKLCTT